MRVLYCHPLPDSKARDAIAFVDIELNEHVRLYALRLIRQPDGRHTLHAPTCGKRQAATFSKPLAARLTALAVEAYEAANER